MSPVLGLRANLGQFALLVAVSALVGGMVGQERTVLPLLATDVFGLTGFVSALTFVVAFGIAKAFTNLAAGALADRFGRKPVLVAGWLVGLPVPILIILAPSWGWIVVANLLLGVNQGLTWSTTVIMKIDLVGPVRRGLATGINEAAGYGAVALTALADGLDRGRVRPPARALLPRAGLCVPRPRCVGPVRPRDARPCRARAGDGRATRGPALARGLLAHDPARPRPLGGLAGRASSTTSTTGWPGACSRCSTRRRACRSARSVSSPRPTRRCGRSARSDRRAVGPDRAQAAHRRRHVGPGAARSP